MANSPAKPKILPLTSARFFAALYVVLYHSALGVPALRNCNGALRRILEMGHISVSFFFMLSGFILAVVYLKDRGSINKRRFLVARFARIYPLYLAAMLLDTPHMLYTQFHILHASIRQVILGFLATATLVQAWVNMRGLNPPGWSLSAEVFFYITFPFIGIALWRMRGWLVLPMSAVFYFGGIYLVTLMVKFGDADEQAFNPFPYLFLFLLGILLARIYTWISQDAVWANRLEAWAPWLLLTSVIGVFAVPVFRLIPSETLLLHGILAPLYGLAILAFASGNLFINRAFSASWLVVLGEASYALYLIHYPIHSILRGSIERYGLPMFAVFLAGTIGLSVASYYLLEIPARRWILKKERVRSLETEVTSAIAQ
ncbi:acyltransferase [Edaphobacter sp. 12200R-103]|uniref:acyltransferase family protein n=1 Tax=Edaphobacter sp. 12200R-103 TaxID=2703788 RepID=UPI00138C759C|nr:acyltransferase [Edaphobacter sp. 12200R-103]QHS51936.1 acyltransferase [Edaphobacter sp. 12200R-103]